MMVPLLAEVVEELVGLVIDAGAAAAICTELSAEALAGRLAAPTEAAAAAAPGGGRVSSVVRLQLVLGVVARLGELLLQLCAPRREAEAQGLADRVHLH